MKTTKRIFLLVFSAMFFATTQTLNAQVTIGAEKVPEDFSALEIASTAGGLRLPQLSTKQRDNLAVSGKALAKGLSIYNTDLDCLEIWNGTEWLSNCGQKLTEGAPLIVIQPQSQFITQANWDNPVANELKVTATGLNVNYQWFKIVGNTATEIVGETNSTFTPADAITYYPNIYYCVVYNTYGAVESKHVSVVKVGKANGGNNQSFYFMCHNLGSDYTANPLTPAANIHGDKYRFGAKYASLKMSSDQATTDPITGWTANNTTEFPLLSSGDWSADNNPCPSGWRLPSKNEWDQIINNNTTTYKGNWSAGVDYGAGIMIGTDIFLPAAYCRDYDYGALSILRRGCYWSMNSVAAGFGTYFTFNETNIYINNARVGYGMSVRCIAKHE